MNLDLAEKARARRIEALTNLPDRRIRRDTVGGFRLFPALGPEEIGALFASSRTHFDQNIFSV
jgi:hypothetical protein